MPREITVQYMPDDFISGIHRDIRGLRMILADPSLDRNSFVGQAVGKAFAQGRLIHIRLHLQKGPLTPQGFEEIRVSAIQEVLKDRRVGRFRKG